MAKPHDESPVLELRPVASRFIPDAFRRARSNSVIRALLLAGLAGLGAAIAFGHSSALMVVEIALAATVLLAFGVLGWFALTVFGAQWTVYPDRLVVRRPGAKQLRIPLSDVAAVRLESISGFGMNEPILVLLDASGGVLLWTVASRWVDNDLNQLWTQLRRRPTEALGTVVDYQTMPYDRRY